MEATSPWSITATLKHYAAAPRSRKTTLIDSAASSVTAVAIISRAPWFTEPVEDIVQPSVSFDAVVPKTRNSQVLVAAVLELGRSDCHQVSDIWSRSTLKVSPK